MMKRINLRAISCLLAVMLIMASVMTAPYEVSAETASPSVIADGECGDNLTWTLDDSGTLTVSGTGDMWDFDPPTVGFRVHPVQPWCRYYDKIITVQINDGVTNIGEIAFMGCHVLENVVIPDSVVHIRAMAFLDCGALTDITLPDSLTSIGYRAFSGCSLIQSVMIPNSVTSIADGAFERCSALENIRVDENHPKYTSVDGVLYTKDKTDLLCFPAGKKEIQILDGVTRIRGYAFSGCGALSENTTSITLPDTVTSIGENAFRSFSTLTGILLPDSVTSIGQYAFAGCSSLRSVQLSNSMTSISNGVFEGCNALETATIPNGVTAIGYSAFHSCRALKSVILPDGVTSIGYLAFYGCSALKTITIPNSVKNIGNNVFGSCSALTIYGVAGSYAETYANENKIPFAVEAPCEDGAHIYGEWTRVTEPTYTEKGSEKRVCIRKGCGASETRDVPPLEVPSPSVIADGECGDDLTWTLDDSGTLTVSGTGDMWNYDYAIPEWSSDDKKKPGENYRDKIIAIDINNGVTSIGGSAFSGCGALTSVTIPESVTRIGASAFSDCKALENITIPESVMRIGTHAFYHTAYYNNDENWENGFLYLGNRLIKAEDSIAGTYTIRPGTISIEDSAFSFCKSLESITIPDGVTRIGYDAFSFCISLESITLPDSVTSIGEDAFQGCNALESITLPAGVTSIGKRAFYLCRALKSITIPDGVTSIGAGMFYGCRSLTSITLPDSVMSIENHAFRDCGALTSITIPDSVTSIGGSAFEDCYVLESITIPDRVTSIGLGAFVNCSVLKNIQVDENNQSYVSVDGVLYTKDMTTLICCPAGGKEAQIPDSVTSIEAYAFVGCDALESITIPNRVTSIGWAAFWNCTALTSITLPDSITSIGNGAFSGCDKFTIYGTSGSYAQEYAKKCSIPFRSGVFVGDRFFLDVKPGAWYLSAVEYVLDNRLFFGVSPKMFAPDVSMTRAMLVTVLWRMEGEPAVSGENPFRDVPSGQWYTDAVKWAAENGIVNGISEDKYDPMADVTREQAAAILYRYSRYKGYDVSKTADLSAFPDGNKTSDYAVTELSWAYGERLITGVKKGDTDYLEPQGNATRAQVASILMRYKKSFLDREKTTSVRMPFF